MKKVIFKTETDTISVDELNDSHIIGVKLKTGEIGYIGRVFEGYIYCFASIGMNKGSYGTFESISEILNHLNLKTAYVFNTPKELYLWMAE